MRGRTIVLRRSDLWWAVGYFWAVGLASGCLFSAGVEYVAKNGAAKTGSGPK